MVVGVERGGRRSCKARIPATQAQAHWRRSWLVCVLGCGCMHVPVIGLKSACATLSSPDLCLRALSRALPSVVYQILGVRVALYGCACAS